MDQPIIGNITQLKARPPQFIEDFETTVQDIAVCVKGEYSPADLNVGMPAYYIIERVWLPQDMAAQDITHILEQIDGVYERIEEEGVKIMGEREFYGDKT